MRQGALAAVAIAGLVVLGASPAYAAKVKPDAFIKESGAPNYVGKRVYSPPSPVDPDQTATETGDAQFTVVVKNRGTERDTFLIQAQGSLVNGGYRQIYIKGQNVTAEAEAGDLKLKRIAPGASKHFRIEHGTPTTDAAVTTFITASSKNNSNKSDTVRGHTPPFGP